MANSKETESQLKTKINKLRTELDEIEQKIIAKKQGLMNNQDGLIEAFKEIQKLKQTQKGIIYH